MSNVLRKDRRETKLQVAIDGMQLRTEIARFLIKSTISDQVKYILGDSIFQCTEKLCDKLDKLALVESPDNNIQGNTTGIAWDCYILTQNLHSKLVTLVECTTPNTVSKLGTSIDLLLKIRDFLERRYKIKE